MMERVFNKVVQLLVVTTAGELDSVLGTLPHGVRFGVARELYERIQVPDRLLSFDNGASVSPDEIEREFLAANPWLSAETIAVTCRKQKLLDIRVCFGRDLFPRPCGGNEDQKRLCPLSKIGVPPVEP